MTRTASPGHRSDDERRCPTCHLVPILVTVQEAGGLETTVLCERPVCPLRPPADEEPPPS
jgi:hypothetical protein